MEPEARVAAARAYCTLAGLVHPHLPVLAARLIDSAAKVLAGLTPIWDEAEELQRLYLSDD